MTRGWEYRYGGDDSDGHYDGEHLTVEYRPGDTIDLIAVGDGQGSGNMAELVGMPWARFEEMVARMRGFHASDPNVGADG